jgi:hypothetical protein
LVRSGFSTGRDGEPIPCIDRSDGEGQIGQFLSFSRANAGTVNVRIGVVWKCHLGVCSAQKSMSIQQKLVLGTAIAAFLLPNLAIAGQQRHSRKPPTKQEQAAAAPQPTPAPPPTPEQMPASPPQVTFDNGQLTIVAQNSTLGDILRAVRTKTGAAVEVPGNATERVVAKIGPGPAREVLASLLNGSHFNYVMLGSPTKADMVDRIILTSKSGAEPTAAASNPPPAPNEPGYTGPQAADGRPLEPEETQNEDVAQDAPEPENEGAAAGEEQANQPNGQSGVKTPEQLLRELQQQQQQLQQQQQGAPQGFPTPQNPNPQQNQPQQQ